MAILPSLAQYVTSIPSILKGKPLPAIYKKLYEYDSMETSMCALYLGHIGYRRGEKHWKTNLWREEGGTGTLYKKVEEAE